MPILTRAKAIKKMRARFPTANLLVYDNCNALAVGFASTEKTSEAIFSNCALSQVCEPLLPAERGGAARSYRTTPDGGPFRWSAR
jgi:hypothetical protein